MKKCKYINKKLDFEKIDWEKFYKKIKNWDEVIPVFLEEYELKELTDSKQKKEVCKTVFINLVDFSLINSDIEQREEYITNLITKLADYHADTHVQFIVAGRFISQTYEFLQN